MVSDEVGCSSRTFSQKEPPKTQDLARDLINDLGEHGVQGAEGLAPRLMAESREVRAKARPSSDGGTLPRPR